MKSRPAKFLVAIIASILSSANVFAAPENAERRADACLTSPREYAPPGTRWRYRVERGTGRHCWFLKDDAAKTAGKADAQSTAETEEPAPAPPRKKSATPSSVSDARAEFSQTPVEQDTRPAPVQNAPAPAPAIDSNQSAPSRAANNMLAPAAATRWSDPMSTGNPVANQPAPAAAPADQSSETMRAATAATPPAKPQAMPRAVPPTPVTEQSMSLSMLVTVIGGGLSVLAVLVSMFFAWLASRRNRLRLSEPMPQEMPDQPRRPGDLYRERKRLRALSGRRAA